MNKTYILSLALASLALTAMAQRQTDQLDRGLVAIRTTNGVYCSWRIQADEYYDTQYDLYRNGVKVNDTPLSVSNYLVSGASASDTFTVRAIHRGQEQTACSEAKVWDKPYLEVNPQHDASLTSTYVPNDACCADVDGDGQVEILLKYDNQSEINASYPRDGYNGEYSLFECLKLDGTVLWWVNCGPNMGDFQNNEQNIVAYDWDGDGRAEAIFRAADGTTIHMADGSVYTVGDASLNYRDATGGGTNWFMHSGAEFLLYVDGQTGQPYQCMDYPLPRLEESENPSHLLSGSAYDNLVKNAWGDGYGHRSSKHFFGAPYLDGLKPSIFLGRGIYTQHKFVTYDVDPATHQLVERWRWNNKNPGPWYGQGYHNYTIADVDWDGRDEIVWGSMVIDDNGLGLSTTGLGHGDAHHVGDFNPYTHGQEGFFCNEDEPANNYRDLTTSKIYYRMVDTNDAGRSMAGNFTDDYPGAIGWGAHDSPISTVTNDHVDGMQTTGLTQNFRIYWDGDLLEECFDGGYVYKYGKSNSLIHFEGGYTNNGTKNTPCYQGDILGDWREEVIERTADNKIRIYTTTDVTKWRNYSLWYDHQYRNAMVWQMCGYNQPPHVSYFLGELEGITMAPPPLTTTGRTVIHDGESITAANNDQHVLICENKNASVAVAEGATPYILTVNAPSWIQGTAESGCTQKEVAIDESFYSLTLTGTGLSGNTRLVKQGDGLLKLSSDQITHSGPTEIWAGTLTFDGSMINSNVWLNRFAVLNAKGYAKTIHAEYASLIRLNLDGSSGYLWTDTLYLAAGARVEFVLGSGDLLSAQHLIIEKKQWQNGPKYSSPVFNFVCRDNNIVPGKYTLAVLGFKDDGTVDLPEGNIDDIVIEGLNGMKTRLFIEDQYIQLEIAEARPAEEITWTGAESSIWDLDNTPNFASSTQTFVSGDDVTFNDDATRFDVNIAEALSPGSVVFTNESKPYTLSGAGRLSGDFALTLNGAGSVSIENTNDFTGGVYLNHGTLIPSLLANKDGVAEAALGPVDNNIIISNEAELKIQSSMTASQPIVLGERGGALNITNGNTLILNGNIHRQTNGSKTNLYKKGKGTLQLDCSNTFDTLYLNEGIVYDFGDNHFNNKAIVLGNGTLQYNNSIYSSNTENARFIVPEGTTGTLYPDGRCDYTGSLTGAGTLNLWATWVRCSFQGDWSQFTGTIKAYQGPKYTYDPTFDFNNTKGIGLATLDIQSGCCVNTNGKAFAIGALTGSGSISNAGYWGSSVNTLSIGGKNIDFTFNGEILTSNVSKVGTGTWTIASATTMASAGQLSINEGAVKLNNTNADRSMTGEKKVQVNDGGTIFGRGMVRDINVKVGGSIIPGNSITNFVTNAGLIRAENSINIDGDLYLNKTSKDDYNSKGVPQYSGLACAGALTINGTIHVSYRNTWTPAEGDSIPAFTAGSLQGNPTFDLQTLPDGLSWDVSTLMEDGVIRVVASSGIHQVMNDEGLLQCHVYDVAGCLVASFAVNSSDEVPAVMRQQDLQSAVYLVRMQSGNSVTVTRFILER